MCTLPEPSVRDRRWQDVQRAERGRALSMPENIHILWASFCNGFGGLLMNMQGIHHGHARAPDQTPSHRSSRKFQSPLVSLLQPFMCIFNMYTSCTLHVHQHPPLILKNHASCNAPPLYLPPHQTSRSALKTSTIFHACCTNIRYHLLQPEYIMHRIKAVPKNAFVLRILLVHVDVDDAAKPLGEVTKSATLNDFTLVCAWSAEVK